jgi:hypothetical protein
MFELQNRAAEVTQHMNVRGENHGDDVKTAIDVVLKGIALTPAETCEVFKDPDAYDRLFRKMADSDVLDPVFKQVKKFPIGYNFESARVEINTGHGKPIVLADCSIGRLSVTTGDCGKVALQGQIQCVAKEAERGRLTSLIGTNVHVSIRVQNEQPDMLEGDKAGKGKREVSGGFKPTRTGKQIDAEIRANGKRKRKAVKAKNATTNGAESAPAHDA